MIDLAKAPRALEMRADLMAALRMHIEKRGWTQSDAANQLGITQPRVSALMKSAWRGFSADMLLALAVRMGLRPTLKLAAQRARHGQKRNLRYGLTTLNQSLTCEPCGWPPSRD